MNKPIYLWPFIFVYRMVSFIINSIIKLVRYISLGFFFFSIIIISKVIDLIYGLFKYNIYGVIYISYLVYIIINKCFGSFKYILKGFYVLSYLLYRFIYYVLRGLITPFVAFYLMLSSLLNNLRINSEKIKAKKEIAQHKKDNLLRQKEEERKRKLEAKEKEKIEALALKDRKREDEARRKEELRKKKEKDEYVNENVKLEKKSFGERLNSSLEKLINFPKKIKENIIKRWHNLSVVKNKRNKLEIDRQALLINFDSEDAVKSDTKILYEYVARNTDGEVIKGHFEAFSKVEVHSYLLSEGFEVYSIRTNKWITFLHGRSQINTVKVKNKDLIFFLTQLSTYIKAGIPLVEALKILTRQYRSRSYQRIFKTMIYDLTMGENFSTALDKQGVAFPRLLVNMVKAAEMTGELPEALDNMADYYTEVEKTRKQMITAMIYPSIVFIMSIAVVTFIILFVVPKFVEIYDTMNSDQIPRFTKLVIGVSDYLEDNIIWLFISFVVIILVLHYLYKNVKIIRTFMQWLMMRMPVIGNIIIYNEVTIFTKTLASLLSHNVFITESMEVLNKITNNEIYKMIILDTITNIARGESTSSAFQGHWAFPIPAYEMLVTGEKTGQLPDMMVKVADYYQDLHKNAVSRLKTLIEPLVLVFLTVVVGLIILAIILPMFDALNTIK